MNLDVIYYPRLSRRIGAMLADSLVLTATLFSTIFIAGLTKEHSYLKSFLIIFITVSVEPLCVSLTGSSIGHHIYGLRVRKENEDKPIGITTSYARFFIKFFLSWISLIFIQTTAKHQALHDITCKSLVVYKHPEHISHHERLRERKSDRDQFIYPGVLRRVVLIFFYIILSYIAVSVATFLLSSSSCVSHGSCSNLDAFVIVTLSLTFWISLFTISFYGWNGRLYGCRKKPKPQTTEIEKQ